MTIEGDLSEFQEFLGESFDAQKFALGCSSTDIPTTLTRLSFSIDNINKYFLSSFNIVLRLIFDQVSKNYDLLVNQVSHLQDLDSNVAEIKEKTQLLNKSFAQIKTKIFSPRDKIKSKILQLERIQSTTEVLRQVIRFMHLAKRLETCFSNDIPEFVAAASTINEIDAIISNVDLSAINVVSEEIIKINEFRKRVVENAENILSRGFSTQSQADITEGLVIYFSLDLLQTTVHSILDLSLSQLKLSIDKVFDIVGIGKDAGFVVNITTTVKKNDSTGLANFNLFKAKFFERFESFVDEMFINFQKIQLLDRILMRRKNTSTMESFQSIIARDINESVSSYYWRTLSIQFEKDLKHTVKNSVYLQHVLQNSYPKFLRILKELFNRIRTLSIVGNNTDAVLESQNQIYDHQAMLKPLLTIEHSYLAKSLAKLLDMVSAAFPSDRPGIRGHLPTRDDVDKLIRVSTGELELVKFDEKLLKLIAKNVSKAIQTFASKVETASSTDSSTFQFSGLGTASSSQLLNLDLINSCWRLKEGMWVLLTGYEDDFIAGNTNFEAVVDILGKVVESLTSLVQSIVEPLFVNMVIELEKTFLKMHLDDYAKYLLIFWLNNFRPSQPSIGNKGKTVETSSAAAQYLPEFNGKIKWISREIFSRFQCGDDSKEWIQDFGLALCDLQLRHITAVCPLNDAGKLKLASDMTYFEFNINQFFNQYGLKFDQHPKLSETYKSFKMFKSLLFLEPSQFQSPEHTSSLPKLVLIQNLFVRAYPKIRGAREVNGWSFGEYFEFLDNVDEEEVFAEFGRCLELYGEDVKKKGKTHFCPEYPVLKAFLKKI